MKAVAMFEYGGPEVLKVMDVARPIPKPNEVLVKVHLSSITTADTMMRSGTPKFGRLFLGFPRPRKNIVGTGFAGTVVGLGEQATGFAIGDAVFGETSVNFGANAEYLCIAEDGIILQKPEFLPFSEAATFCDGVLTSYNFLKYVGQLQPGQKVLINGASGALGTAAIQLAKVLGTSEVVAVCSAENRELAESLGATKVIDYRQQDFTQQPETYDIVFDTIGKSSFSACKKILTANGQYLTPVLTLSVLWQSLLTRLGRGKSAQFAATGLLPAPKLKSMLQEILPIYGRGQLRVPIEQRYSVGEIAEAHRHIATGRKKGNIVLQFCRSEKYPFAQMLEEQAY